MALNLSAFLEKQTKAILRLGAAAEKREKLKAHLRVATFNVRFGKYPEKIAQVFLENFNLRQADVILIQEIEDHKKEKQSRAERLAKYLGMNFMYIPSRWLPLKRGTHGVAVFSRLPFTSAEAIRLPVYRVLSFHPRVAAAAEIKFLGKKIKIYNVHLNGSLNYRKREEQLKAVIDQIKEEDSGQPFVLAGDFNMIPLVTLADTSVPLFYSNQKKKLHKLLLNFGFDTACEAAGHTTKWGAVRFQLDGIYPKNCRIAAFGVERGVKISDHFPVWADIEF